jgi:hypothetical protein
MKLEFLIVTIALIVLVFSLVLVFFNLQNKENTFPKSMTNCPDYWQVNTETGNCIIPSKDQVNANLGNPARSTLQKNGTPIYIYKFRDDDIRYSNFSVMKIKNKTDESITEIKGTPYMKDGYKVYAYNLDSSDYDIPIGYYTVPVSNTSTEYSKYQEILFENIYNNGNEINFNDVAWSTYEGGGSTMCQIKKWVNENGIVWDGLDTYNKCANS